MYHPDYTIKKEPYILGIESSCDETAAAVIRGRTLLSSEIISSASEQAKFGGVVPEIASRAHTEAVSEVVLRALKSADITADRLDAVAVTYGAGLLGALLVGLSFAKGLAYSLNIPLIGVSHIRGHLAAAYLVDSELKPPFMTLLASGGHTAILLTESYSSFRFLGGTCDDAVGEAFDKVARVLGLEYPGGANVERLAREGAQTVRLPSALVKNSAHMQFSYSGIKTAVINAVHNAEQRGEKLNPADIACSFQHAAIDPLVKKTVECAKAASVGVVTAGGGVIANGYLRDTLASACRKANIRCVLPEKRFCTDNAAMIAAEGLIRYLAEDFSDLSLNASARVALV